MNVDVQQFLEKVNKELKFDEYRERFIEELEDHVEDGVREREFQGTKEENACKETLAQLGDTKELTSTYNFIIMSFKKPIISFIYFIGIWISIASIGLLLIAIIGGFVYPQIHSYVNTRFDILF